ncbi:hypothetical protein [Devosia sp. 1566]|uniref:COG4223 family protein n=1 Tax=Devosia sp. 1566 TaxID=2499144 RepID=UPI000FDC52C5|nr:hypothetical protein [Devosia sp. 1566]
MADDTDPKNGTAKPADPAAKDAGSPNAAPQDSKPAETRTGPVKPPVLDLKARPGDSDSGKADRPHPGPAPKSAPKSSPLGSSRDAAPAPTTARSGSRTGATAGAVVGGGLLGLAAAYGLAFAGLWPTPDLPTPPPAPEDPRLAQFASAIPELETVTQTTQAELAALHSRIAELETAEPAAPEPAAAPVDLSGIETQIAALQTRIDELDARPAAPATSPGTPAAPPGAAVPADPAALEALRTDLAGLAGRVDQLSTLPQQVEQLSALPAQVEQLSALPAQVAQLETLPAQVDQLNALPPRVDELAARLGTTEANLRNLDTAVAQTTATLAGQPEDIGAVLQLPLILSGLEAAFSTGRPYEAELGALRAALPAVSIPLPIANGAATGIARPDQVAQRFNEVLPAILAGRPADPQAGWAEGALDWLRSAVAIRPVGEREGDDPEAIVTRLEAAIARRDWAAAEALFAQLPEPMRAAAGDVPTLVATEAEAARFLDTLRAQALSGEAAS